MPAERLFSTVWFCSKNRITEGCSLANIMSAYLFSSARRVARVRGCDRAQAISSSIRRTRSSTRLLTISSLLLKW